MASHRAQRFFWPLFLLAVALGGLWAFLYKDPFQTQTQNSSPETLYKSPIPDVLLLDPSGAELNLKGVLQDILEEEKTERVILSFWATWCPPCLKEIPDLSRKRAAYRDAGTSIVLVSFDKSFLELDRSKVMAWLTLYDVDLLNVFDPKEALIQELNLSALPFNAIVDKERNILWASEGILRFEEIEKKFHDRPKN